MSMMECAHCREIYDARELACCPDCGRMVCPDCAEACDCAEPILF